MPAEREAETTAVVARTPVGVVTVAVDQRRQPFVQVIVCRLGYLACPFLSN
jgi:hypothetical protein